LIYHTTFAITVHGITRENTVNAYSYCIFVKKIVFTTIARHKNVSAVTKFNIVNFNYHCMMIAQSNQQKMTRKGTMHRNI